MTTAIAPIHPRWLRVTHWIDALAVLLMSGLALWKSVHLPLLRELLGSSETARRVHFVVMGAMVSFVAIHLVMVALVPRTLVTMIRGS